MVVTTLLYGAVAMIALVIASLWLIEKTAAARLATTALGASGALAGVLVWVLRRPRRRRLPRHRPEHLDGSRRVRGLPGLGGCGRDRRPDHALRRLPDQAADAGRLPRRGAEVLDAHRFLVVRGGRSARHRLPDRVVARPAAPLYDSVALTVSTCHRLHRAYGCDANSPRAGLSSTVIAAFSGVLLSSPPPSWSSASRSPRVTPSRCPNPDAIYGNDLAQQITSTFDVTVCALSFAILVAMLFTGPLAGYLIRRRDARTATPAPSPEPSPSAPPTLARPPQPAAVPKIVRLREDSTTVLAAPTEEISAPTAALRILRRTPASDPTTQVPTTQVPTPPNDADEQATQSGPVTDG